MRYSDAQLTGNTQGLFLETAGFVIKLVFEPTEQVYFKRRLLEEVERVWGKGGFLLSSPKKAAFEIRLSASQIEILQKEKGKRHYYSTFLRDFPKNKVTTFYHIGLLAFQVLLKEVFTFLVKNGGFLFHASGCLDKTGDLKIFSAPQEGGKTTVSNLLSKGEGLVKFSDDILIVRKIRNSWRFFSPPFIEKQALPVKREAKNAEIFFIEKSKKAAKKELQDSKVILPLVLNQIWSKTGSIDKRTLKNIMAFVQDNKFFWLNSVLDEKALRRVLYES